MNKYIIIVNNGLYYDNVLQKNIFSREELEKSFIVWSKGNEMVDEEGDKISIDDLIESKREVWTESMVERGDDWVEVEICEIKE
jgi:hypothetical protein